MLELLANLTAGQHNQSHSDGYELLFAVLFYKSDILDYLSSKSLYMFVFSNCNMYYFNTKGLVHRGMFESIMDIYVISERLNVE